MALKVRTKKKDTGPHDTKTLKQLRRLLRELAEVEEERAALREEYETVFEAYDDLNASIEDKHTQLKALAKPGALKMKKSGLIESSDGFRITCTLRRNIDGNKLAELAPKILEVGQLNIGVTQQEAQRLIAAGVIDEKQLKRVTSTSPSLSIKADG